MTQKGGHTKPFTAEQTALLEQMKAAGKSWTEISEACGHTANSCATTFSLRKRFPKKGSHRPWPPDDVVRLRHMRRVLHMSFQDIGIELGRTTSACHTKYNVTVDEPAPIHGQPEPGARVSITPAAIADRDARYQLWLQQHPVARMMGDPLPGRSARDGYVGQSKQ